MSIRVLASVIRRGDHVLVCQRPLGKRHGGLWEFPGGKVEPGESDLAAVTRELHEELGIGVRSVGSPIFAMTDPGSDFIVHFLLVEVEGEARALEHAEIRWVRTTELVALDLAPSDAEFAAFLARLERDTEGY